MPWEHSLHECSETRGQPLPCNVRPFAVSAVTALPHEKALM
jgi:hypothetical protein